ncbi:MAG TPA: tyrosine-protein phosphatase [Galbitalea sp.]
MTSERESRRLNLENAWDLGGLPTGVGSTRSGQLFRSMKPDALDMNGWAAMIASGVTTIVDLRNDDEVLTETLRPVALVVHRRPVEDQGDDDFMAEWGNRLGSPVVLPGGAEALARAHRGRHRRNCRCPEPGAVPLRGRTRPHRDDSAMIEELVGVDRTAILDDHADVVRAFHGWKRSDEFREAPQTDDQLDANLATALAELGTFLDAIDIEQYLLDAGLSDEQLSRIRPRLLDD